MPASLSQCRVMRLCPPSLPTFAPTPARRFGPMVKRPLQPRLSHEVEEDDAEALMQTAHLLKQTFSAEAISTLRGAMAVTEYKDGQVILQKGESGTWFGLLLTGALAVEVARDEVVELAPGDVVGEMAIWEPDSRRTASVTGKTGGLIASMMIDELQAFVTEHPAVGVPLMRAIAERAKVHWGRKSSKARRA